MTALRNPSWDAVISDFVLPKFDGSEALRLLRQQDLDTPFIMVSGIYGEAAAVRMMEARANDYVMTRDRNFTNACSTDPIVTQT